MNRIYCYNLHDGRILYWDVDRNLWGVRRERDGEYYPELVRWYPSREEAERSIE